MNLTLNSDWDMVPVRCWEQLQPNAPHTVQPYGRFFHSAASFWDDYADVGMRERVLMVIYGGVS